MLNDDLISAYLDGELDAERRAMVENHLRTDSGAAARLERLRNADGLLREAFPAAAQARDDLFAAMIMAPSPQQTRRRWATQAAALAAVLLCGVVVGQFVRFSSAPAPYAVSANQAHLLDTLPSGESARADGATFEAILSVRSDDGDFCRQFRLTSGDSASDVLACRAENGGWRMAAAAPAAVVDEFIPASGAPVFDAAIQALGPVNVLDAEQERAYLSR